MSKTWHTEDADTYIMESSYLSSANLETLKVAEAAIVQNASVQTLPEMPLSNVISSHDKFAKTAWKDTYGIPRKIPTLRRGRPTLQTCVESFMRTDWSIEDAQLYLRESVNLPVSWANYYLMIMIEDRASYVVDDDCPEDLPDPLPIHKGVWDLYSLLNKDKLDNVRNHAEANL